MLMSINKASIQNYIESKIYHPAKRYKNDGTLTW